MNYDNKIGDCHLVIESVHGESVSLATIKDEFPGSALQNQAVLTELECTRLIAEFEDVEGELMYHDNSVHMQHFKEFMP